MNPLAALPAIASVYSLFGGASQQNAAKRQQDEARRQQMEANRLAKQQYAELQEQVRQQRVSGVGDPNAALKSIDELYQSGMSLALPNLTRAAKTAGARAGDTSIVDAIHGLTERGLAARNAEVLRVKQAALNDSLRLTQLLQGGSAQLQNSLNDSAARLNYQAAQNPGDVASGIAGLGSIDWDGIFGRKKPTTPYKKTGAYGQLAGALGF